MNQPIDINHAFRVIGLALLASHDCIVTDNVNAVGDGYHWRINNNDALAMLDALTQHLISRDAKRLADDAAKRKPDIEFVMESGKTMKVYIRG